MSPMPRADPPPTRVALLGVPFDGHSSYLRGAARAPARIRRALHSPARSLSTEDGRDLGAESFWRDLGDLALAGEENPMARIEQAAGEVLAGGERLLALGGDHSISWPLVRAHARHHPELVIVQLDAHPDLYDELDGDRASHGCPFARIMEEGLAARLVQVGIRAATPHQREQAERFGVEMLPPGRWRELAGRLDDRPVYLSLDLDCLDPAFAPGVSHPEPGGLSTRDLLGLLGAIEAPLVGADLVELNPLRDPQGLTAVVAAKLVKELLGRLARPPALRASASPR